jgi:hypothetical protein
MYLEAGKDIKAEEAISAGKDIYAIGNIYAKSIKFNHALSCEVLDIKDDIFCEMGDRMRINAKNERGTLKLGNMMKP